MCMLHCGRHSTRHSEPRFMDAFAAIDAPGKALSHWLRLLFDKAPPLHFDSDVPFIRRGAVHLPRPDGGLQGAAAAAHAAAHLVYSPPIFDGEGLGAISRALVGTLEDARGRGTCNARAARVGAALAAVAHRHADTRLELRGLVAAARPRARRSDLRRSGCLGSQGSRPLLSRCNARSRSAAHTF